MATRDAASPSGASHSPLPTGRGADGEGVSLKTSRTTLRRKPDRGSHDLETVARILDGAVYCHIGFVQDGQPYVIPTAFGRDGDRLYIHGSSASRMLRTLGDGVAVCLTATLIDGLVLGRSAFHMSTDFRSVMVLGTARVVDGEEKVHGLATIIEHMVPGRWPDVRKPNDTELKATAVLRLDITEASAKIRDVGVVDEEEDYSLPVWAGVIPLALVPGTPIPDPRSLTGLAVPDYAASYRRPARQF
jgi:nitroimidazol reductase NimA-like FMN-containing flavoprotein (pyridoxamine 5'-phosphate oxidase superfamily)